MELNEWATKSPYPKLFVGNSGQVFDVEEEVVLWKATIKARTTELEDLRSSAGIVGFCVWTNSHFFSYRNRIPRGTRYYSRQSNDL
jgi:hypothetical protein